jgi:hypothetical protein
MEEDPMTQNRSLTDSGGPTWMFPESIVVLHSLGRCEFERFDHYELDDRGNLAVIVDGELEALFPAGKWDLLRADRYRLDSENESSTGRTDG